MVKFLKYSTLVVIGLIVLALSLLNLAIRPENVKNLVERYSKEFMNAEVAADTIEIHLLRNFPYASLSIKNCSIRSMAFDSLDAASRALVPAEADSLARIGSLNVSLSLVDLFFDNINIKGVELESARINGYMSQFGINNWDIMKETADSTSSDSTSFGININTVSIADGAEITLSNIKDSILYGFNLRELKLNGRLSSNIDDNYISKAHLSSLVISSDRLNKAMVDSALDNSMKFSLDTLDISKRHNSDKADVDVRIRTDLKLHGVTLASGIPLGMKGGLELKDIDNGTLGISLDGFTVYAATLPVTMDGSMVLSDSMLTINGLEGRTDRYSIKNLLEYIPEAYLEPGIIETDAAIDVHARIDGRYVFASGELPKVDISLSVPSSRLELKDGKNSRKTALENIEAELDMHFDQSNPQGNTINISRFAVDGRGISLAAKARIDEYTLDPLIDLDIAGRMDLDTLSNMIPESMNMVARGSAECGFSLKGRMSTLNLFSLSQNSIEGKIVSESLRLEMPDNGIDFKCRNASLFAGALKNDFDTLLSGKDRILSLKLNLDTLYLKYKDSLLVSGSKFEMHANQEPLKIKNGAATNSINIHGELNFKGLTAVTPDSSRISARGAENSFSIYPQKDGKTPTFEFRSGMRSISMAMNGSRIFARNPAASLKVATTPYNKENVSDSTDRKKRLMRTILNDWSISGSISSENGRIITPRFPLRTRFSNLNLSVNNDGLDFQNTRFDIGRSTITLSGKLQGFSKAVTKHETLKFTGYVGTDSLDVNQILHAVSNSKDISMTDNRSDDTIETAMENAETADTSVMKAPLVPEFLDADINLDLNNVVFMNNSLKSIQGNLMAHNGIFQMNGFRIGTESGEIDLGAFYAAKQKDDISLGFDMRMNKFEVADLIKFIPDIDTMLPMFRSFSGKITCTLSLMTKMDSLMNLKLETMNGLGLIEGENVVLMDGETFAEIAKKLKFKNKERNLIDRISVQFVSADNKIEIFPFVINMDRYKAAVSGTQNLDMSFKYHISVLQSPLPFRIGLNISGTTEDMKFRLGKCMYKNENVPVYTSEMDSVRTNLGKSIKNIFIKGVDTAMDGESTSQLVKVAENEAKKSDSMESLSQEELNTMDTAKGTE